MKTNVLGLTFGSVVFVFIPTILVKANEMLNVPTINHLTARYIGCLLFMIGLALFIYCFMLFRLSGKGTPVPTRPPQKLVANGLFAYSRNPIYISHFLILTGIGLFLGILTIIGYTIIYIICIDFYIKRFEEPELKRRFGDQYINYCKKTPRWIFS